MKDTWYLRSLRDHDTHRGDYDLDKHLVTARCGEVFKPTPLALGGRGLPHPPLDPAQVCPQCADSGCRRLAKGYPNGWTPVVPLDA